MMKEITLVQLVTNAYLRILPQILIHSLELGQTLKEELSLLSP